MWHALGRREVDAGWGNPKERDHHVSPRSR